MFEMTTSHLNYFCLWHSGTFFCPYSMGKVWKLRVKGNGDKGLTIKKKEFIFVYSIKCLLGWGIDVYFVKISD